MIPTLHTARLTLRAPALRDVGAFTRFWTGARTALMGGPWSVREAEAEFPQLTRQWAAQGFGMFAITRTGDDRAIGLVGPFFPAGHPEPELAWNLWDVADEGHGLAREAALAARDWFFAQGAYQTAVSYTHPENTRSHKLAEALGAVVDATAPCPYAPPVRVYRHRGAA
jgi:RimJ/RimL family protein N-acetyltransferase